MLSDLVHDFVKAWPHEALRLWKTSFQPLSQTLELQNQRHDRFEPFRRRQLNHPPCRNRTIYSNQRHLRGTVGILWKISTFRIVQLFLAARKRPHRLYRDLILIPLNHFACIFQIADLDRLVKLAKPIARRVRILLTELRQRMIVNELSFSTMSSPVFVCVRIEIDSGFLGPVDNHLPCLLENRTELPPECLVANVSIFR